MLHIAVVASNYPEGKRFIDYKFQGRIAQVIVSEGRWTLENGDIIYLCHSEGNKDKYKSMIYDAFIVTPQYESLLDVIMHRTMRP